MSVKPNEKIWRYMTFSKFVNMLTTNSLFFARADTFSDQLEGTVNEPTRQRLIDEFKGFGEMGSYHIDQWENMIHDMRKDTYVSCWHLNDVESYSMWKSYSEGDFGVAIQSEFSALVKTILRYGSAAFAGKVVYIDQDNDTYSITDPVHMYFKKPSWYREENEVRVVLSMWKDRQYNTGIGYKAGINVEVDFKDLIQQVYVQPKSPKWFIDTVNGVMEKYGIINKEVKESRLAEK